jgi:hypothetical protein
VPKVKKSVVAEYLSELVEAVIQSKFKSK